MQLALYNGHSISKIQDLEIKGDIEIVGLQKAIRKKAQPINRDSAKFKGPFHNLHKEVITRVDLSKSTERESYVKKEILRMEYKLFKCEGDIISLHICPNLV